VLGAVAAVFLTVGFVSSWAPVWRSLRIEPMKALMPE
jgi:hypothetical protein